MFPRNHMIPIATLPGFSPLPPGSPRVRLCDIFLPAIVFEFSCTGNPEASQCAPDLGRGSGWRRGAIIFSETAFLQRITRIR